jgi:cobalt-zinc-cadmium efflux system protein
MTSSTVDLREHRSRQAGEVSARTMASAVVLTFGFVVVEAIAGVYGRSLALLSDAGHNLADVAALGLSWYALAMGRRPSNHGMTYGYHRVAVVAAMVNAASLGLIALWLVWEAVGRLRMPEPANSTLMIGVALAAIIINVIVTVRLHEGSKSDINIRSAYLHMMGDAVAAFAVILAGVIVAVTERVIADPLVSMVMPRLSCGAVMGSSGKAPLSYSRAHRLGLTWRQSLQPSEQSLV